MSAPVQTPSAPAAVTAAAFNRNCRCVTLDDAALGAALCAESGDPAFHRELAATRPHLFSRTPVFLPRADYDAMRMIARAIERVAAAPGYLEAVGAWMTDIARRDHGPRGAFMGYDFHLAPSGPKLIEINTNAGGALLNAFLARAQIACCAEVERSLTRDALDRFDAAVLAMFQAEWALQGRRATLRRIAIVDDNPKGQFLYPEFVLAQRLFERAGMKAEIVDPQDLHYADGVLRVADAAIDLVYNRLVDFALEEERHAALRAAYRDGAVVVTPNPHTHARLADKRNLTLLSDPDMLRRWGVVESDTGILAGLPRAVRVTAGNADELWCKRKDLFFKPASGYGGKAVYRGDKLTKGVWQSIVAGDYVAQALAAPSERTVEIDGQSVQRKLDVRLYTYAGDVLLAAARLYQGQTTNFRTPGGGFAPVFFV